jgi:hypothetical protein
MADPESSTRVRGRSDDGLLSWLAGLDEQLRVVAVAVEEALTPTAVLDPFRGLHLTDDDVDRLLERRPCDSLVEVHGAAPRPQVDFPELERLEGAFGLTSFDSAVLLIAVAPELDLRYERLYGYLQDDVTLRRPTVDLALTLLCPDPSSRLAGWHRLSEAAPLRRHGLIHLTPMRDRTARLSLSLEPDAQVVRLLVGDIGLDPRLTRWATMSVAEDSDRSAIARQHAVRPARDEPLWGSLARLLLAPDAVAVEMHGRLSPTANRRLAARVAAVLGRPLIDADPSRTGTSGPELKSALMLLVREAWMHEALVHVAFYGSDGLSGRELLDEVLASFPTVAPACLVSLDRQAGAAGLARPSQARLELELPTPDARDRARIWAECLDRNGEAHGVDVVGLAARYRMSREQIEAAVGAARGRAAWESAAGHSLLPRITSDSLSLAARDETRVDLGSLATRIEALGTWSDLVLPDDVHHQLREFCERIGRQAEVLDHGGFADRLGHARGVPALFVGPSGSGKSMAAGIVAAELGLDCFKINLATVVSKYIGETEKNLERIFTAAEGGDLLLFFDECDALFGKRSEVRDAHDRYANIEVAYLLQRLESYAGPVILATNLLYNLDEAFTRRLAFTIHFPMPGPDERREIWERIWPGNTPVAKDVDSGELARRYALSGGHIRNIALAGAFLAATDGSPVTRRHVLHAVRREYQKLGAEPPGIPDA